MHKLFVHLQVFKQNRCMKRILLLILCIAALSAVQTTHAQSLINYDITGCNFREGTISASCVPIYIAYLIGEIFKLTGALAVIMIMIGGFEYTLNSLAGGKEKGVKRIKNGILGMVISGFSFFIIQMIILTLKG